MDPGRGVAARDSSRATVGAILRALGRPLLCGAVLAGLAIPSFAQPVRAADAAGEATPHAHFRRPDACPHCHVVEGDIASPDRFYAGSERFCLGCHRSESLGRSHPVNVAPRERAPSMKIPGAFPLSIDGRLMCLTCHTAHGPYLAPEPSFPGQARFAPPNGSASGYKTFFLRRTSPTKGYAALCRACHEKL